MARFDRALVPVLSRSSGEALPEGEVGPGRQRSALEVRIVARGALTGGRGWGQPCCEGGAAEVANLGQEYGARRSTCACGGPFATQSCP